MIYHSIKIMTPRWHKKAQALRISSLFPAEEKQRARLVERREAKPIQLSICGTQFEVFAGVYQTSVDTELMLQAVNIKANQTFLEVGCGCGAVSLLLAKRCRFGVGVDINPIAVENSISNQKRIGVENVSFLISDVFERVTGKFDILVCNPPYNNHGADDLAARMFWDPNDEMKNKFFSAARRFLKKDGYVYFGWADFADLDGVLPLRLAERAGFRYVGHFVSPSRNGVQRFFVIKLRL